MKFGLICVKPWQTFITSAHRPSRQGFTTKHPFKLDTALHAGTGSIAYVASLSFGWVMITSPEFRALVSQSARLLAEGCERRVSIDLDAGLVNSPDRDGFPHRVSRQYQRDRPQH